MALAFQKYILYVFREMCCNITVKAISNITSISISIHVSITTKEAKLLNLTMDLSNLDIPVTGKLVKFTICLSLLIFGKKM